MNKKGYITLVSVLILISILTVVISTSLIVNQSSNSSILILRNSKQSKAAVDSCAEIALFKLKSDLSYSGNETITNSYGECTIRTLSGSGNTDRIIEVESNFEDAFSKVRISIDQINPEFVISNWEYISDF